MKIMTQWKLNWYSYRLRITSVPSFLNLYDTKDISTRQQWRLEIHKLNIKRPVQMWKREEKLCWGIIPMERRSCSQAVATCPWMTTLKHKNKEGLNRPLFLLRIGSKKLWRNNHVSRMLLFSFKSEIKLTSLRIHTWNFFYVGMVFQKRRQKRKSC